MIYVTGSTYASAAMNLSSPAFTHLSYSQSPDVKFSPTAGDEASYIPARYTCEGSDISPELRIKGVPENTKSLVLIVDDPDAPVGTFVHWVIWNIPPDIKTFKEGQPPPGTQGMTDFRKRSYGGPCPPFGVHRYYFKLYALDTLLDINLNSTKKDVEHAMRDHIIDKAELIGLFKR